MTGKVCVVTGGNSGIGLETCVGLASAGATVVLASRDRDRGLAAQAEVLRRSAGRGRVDLAALDLASMASVRDFAAGVLDRHDRIDVLVNNAGLVLGDPRLTDDGLEMTFGVNHLGHFLLTDLLLERLVASAPARVITVSSVAHRRARRTFDADEAVAPPAGRYDSFATYGRSKLANVAFTRELARRLEGTGVTASCLHPGNVRSGIGSDGDHAGMAALIAAFGRLVLISPERGARTSLHLATVADHRPYNGAYVVRRKVHRPSRLARDDAFARRLWAGSERLVAPRAERGDDA